MKKDSSRERMLAALSCKACEDVPCCFMNFEVLQQKCSDDFDFFEKQMELGLDVRVELPDLPIRFGSSVSIDLYKDQPNGSARPLLHKEYRTPHGSITTTVSQTEDWPYGDQVPLFDDFLAVRTKKYMVTGQEDLPALRDLLSSPSDEDITAFRQMAKTYRQYAQEKDLLFVGGWRNWRTDETAVIGDEAGTMGIDALMWLCGPEAPLFWAYDQPEFFAELIEIIATWNRRRMEIILEAGVDLILKRAWYEGTDFWSPKLYQKFIAPVLREDIKLTHQAGAKFGYLNTSGTSDILEDLLDMEVDVIVGLDPVMGNGTDLETMVRRTKDNICLWGGVNAPFNVEQATPKEIKQAAENAVNICGQSGGFILSPVDNILDRSEKAQLNVIEFIKCWQQMCNQ